MASRNRRSWLLRSIVAALVWTLTSASAAAGVAPTAPPDLLAAAIAARVALGFSIDQAAVAGLSVDSITEYGAALTADELAALDARIQLQFGLNGAREAATRAADVVAGVSIVPSGAVVITTTDPASASTKEVEGVIPAGASVQIVPVAFSRAGLEAIQNALIADLKDLGSRGIDVSAVGIDPLNDQVVVTVAEPASDVADYLHGRYGPALNVHQGTIKTASCTGCKTFSPIRGGLEMLNYHGYDTFWEQCTTGFNARPSASGSTRYVLSAGHCYMSTTTTNIKHDTYYIGTVTADNLLSGCCRLSDSLRITRNGTATGTPWNAIYVETPPHPPVTAYPITSQVNHTAMGVGDAVCTMGVTSQGRCGTITALNQQILIQPGGRWGSTVFLLSGMVKANFYSYPGDSGGPVYIANRAYGTVSAIDGASSYFSAIDLMLDDLSPWGALRLCFNSACS